MVLLILVRVCAGHGSCSLGMLISEGELQPHRAEAGVELGETSYSRSAATMDKHHKGRVDNMRL
jgi:hypothetical protein